MTEQTKHKISIRLKGRKKLAITKLRISKAMTNKPKTKEHKENISKAMKDFFNKKQEENKHERN